MRKSVSLLLAASLAGMLATVAPAQADDGKEAKKEPTGQDLAHNNRKGNCLACHTIPGDPKAISEATIGPPLIAMKARFPDREKLRAQIWDATKNNPATSMPPFGKHKILSEKEIDMIVDYLYTL